MVERDVMEGYVSLKRAREDYGVVIDPGTLKVDLKATKKLRETLVKVTVKEKVMKESGSKQPAKKPKGKRKR
jgi:hypothetical protein